MIDKETFEQLYCLDDTKFIKEVYYTLLQREVLEDNGTESYEIYTMKQPYAVDLSYTINFVTTTVDYLNQFNQKINKLFAARQYYIRPNGHFIPMVIDEISDETAYSISDRKFYVQSVTINLMAYIIENNDFGNVKNVPIDKFNPKITIKKIRFSRREILLT